MNIQFIKEVLDTVLYNDEFSPEKLIEFLSVDMEDIYTADAGVWEGYTIGEHTLMAMYQFERYFSKEVLPGNFDKGIFRFVLALHDVGKVEAIRNGNKDDQHEYTVEILEKIFEHINLKKQSRDIAIALIEADCLGTYIHGKNNLQETVLLLKSCVNRAGIDMQDFFELLTIFYRCDAGSYTEDAGGLKSLDHLFVFDRKKPKLGFVTGIAKKMDVLKGQFM